MPNFGIPRGHFSSIRNYHARSESFPLWHDNFGKLGYEKEDTEYE